MLKMRKASKRGLIFQFHFPRGHGISCEKSVLQILDWCFCNCICILLIVCTYIPVTKIGVFEMRVTVSSWLCLVLFWSCFGVFSLSPFDIIFTLISPYFLLLFESSRILPLGHCSGRRVFPTFKPWTSPPSPRAPRPWPARRSACSPPPGARPSGDSSKKLSVTKATLYCTYSILEWRWVILIFLHVPLEKLDWAHLVEKYYE